MSILTKDYEVSVWAETLTLDGQKKESKQVIIAAPNMDYQGRATNLNLTRELKGTKTFSFQLPTHFFDGSIGEYVVNEFCDYVFNEQKIKVRIEDNWYEFYVKNISEQKIGKGVIYTYSCQDANIEELSRNGYGITFDIELCNNVAEIGEFSETILKDSIWQYDASKNIGDFTEYLKEKLYKIPMSQFKNLKAYKIKYDTDLTKINPYTNKSAAVEMGDDIAAQKKYFWDNGEFDNGYELCSVSIVLNPDYIYVPYSQLDFCYINEDGKRAATQVPKEQEINGIKSYLLSPKTIDPTALIQILAFDEDLQIDEDGVILNKDVHYVTTVEDWNNAIQNELYYNEELHTVTNKYSEISNKAVVYDGYLEKIGDIDVSFGKKISITDRTELNINEDIDQYVKVYNNNPKEYSHLYGEDKWQGKIDGYRVCSYAAERVIVPQLARNFVENAISITRVDGWEVMSLNDVVNEKSSEITVELDKQLSSLGNQSAAKSGKLVFTVNKDCINKNKELRSFVNFGMIGQEKTIEKNKWYCISCDCELINANATITIAKGSTNSKGDYSIVEDNVISFNINRIKTDKKDFLIFYSTTTIENPYIVITLSGTASKDAIMKLNELRLFEAYTKGKDFFEDGYYRYSGRNFLLDVNKDCTKEQNCMVYKNKIPEAWVLLEEDVMEGDVYGYQRYFIQQENIRLDNGEYITRDTFGLKKYLDEDDELFNTEKFTDEDVKIVTNFIDLNKCEYFVNNAASDECDCTFNGKRVCMYQKYGYCPYRFQTQKHCRKVRTLNGEKSNRFNLTQELSKVFEVYPIYHVEYEENGKVKLDENGHQIKKLFFMTEKGVENQLGFKYSKNLNSAARTFDSNEIVTKLYVEDVDSEFSPTGLCSIKTAEDNPSKDSFIINFDYYILKGLLDKKRTNADLYGVDENDIGYLKTLGYYNNKYDEISNKIVGLQDKSYKELEANYTVNTTGIVAAQQERNKNRKYIEKYKASLTEKPISDNIDDWPIVEEVKTTFDSYLLVYQEQTNILYGLIEKTFMKDGKCLVFTEYKDKYGEINYKAAEKQLTAKEFIDDLEKKFINFDNYKNKILDKWLYTEYGIAGQFTSEYKQIQKWKKEQAKYLKDINKISQAFYIKYEPYLKEGTWSDSDYLSNNAYYFGAIEVAKRSSIPNITYSFDVIDIEVLDNQGDYKFDLGDTTFVEDPEIFGINKDTGLPKRQKVLIATVTDVLDNPTQNNIEVKNFTTRFEDIFEQISATVQSLNFNENIYKRASNFTAASGVTKDVMQKSLSENQLTIVETDEQAIVIDNNGQSGSDLDNHSNKYKMNGQGMYFSKDGGQSWEIGVSPNGINADYINVGTLDSQKVQIVDGKNIYFLWDKVGITAYRDPVLEKGLDIEPFSNFSRFNKFGLSLVENNKIRLRTGYSFNGDVTSAQAGDITTESTPGNEIGFYLYNNQGQAIFKTETASSINKKENETTKEYNSRKDAITARLSLSGEMYITDNRLDSEGTGNIVERRRKVNLTNGYKISNISVMRYSEQNLTDSEVKLIKGETVTVVDNISGEIGGRAYNKIITTSKAVKDSEKVSIIEYALINDRLNYKVLKSYLYNINITTQYLYDNALVDEETITEELNLTTKDISLNKKYVISGNVKINTLTAKTTDTVVYYAPQSFNPLINTINYYDCISPVAEMTLQSKQLRNVNAPNNPTYNYWEKYEITQDYQDIIDPTRGITEQIGLFINNKLSSTTDETSADEMVSKRIFSCISSNEIDGEVSKVNLLTILKNGQLTIGGTVEGPFDQDLSKVPMSEIPDEVEIKNPKIRMTQEGTIQMDFNNFLDLEGNPLPQMISDRVAEIKLPKHTHNMETLKFTFNKEDNIKYYIGLKFLDETITLVPQQEELLKKLSALSFRVNSVKEYETWVNYTDEEFIGAAKQIVGYDVGRVLIPIANETYKVSGVSGSAGEGQGGSGGSSGSNRSGYYIIDPLQI